MVCNSIHHAAGVFQRVWLMYRHSRALNAIAIETTGDPAAFGIPIEVFKLSNRSPHRFSRCSKAIMMMNGNHQFEYDSNVHRWEIRSWMILKCTAKLSLFPVGFSTIDIFDVRFLFRNTRNDFNRTMFCKRRMAKACSSLFTLLWHFRHWSGWAKINVSSLEKLSKVLSAQQNAFSLMSPLYSKRWHFAVHIPPFFMLKIQSQTTAILPTKYVITQFYRYKLRFKSIHTFRLSTHNSHRCANFVVFIFQPNEFIWYSTNIKIFVYIYVFIIVIDFHDGNLFSRFIYSNWYTHSVQMMLHVVPIWKLLSGCMWNMMNFQTHPETFN